MAWHFYSFQKRVCFPIDSLALFDIHWKGRQQEQKSLILLVPGHAESFQPQVIVQPPVQLECVEVTGTSNLQFS